jgi:YesN/AraC family two-component response regulator
LGVDRYLLKPAPMEKLIDTLRELADARAADEVANDVANDVANRGAKKPKK